MSWNLSDFAYGDFYPNECVAEFIKRLKDKVNSDYSLSVEGWIDKLAGDKLIDKPASALCKNCDKPENEHPTAKWCEKFEPEDKVCGNCKDAKEHKEKVKNGYC